MPFPGLPACLLDQEEEVDYPYNQLLAHGLAKLVSFVHADLAGKLARLFTVVLYQRARGETPMIDNFLCQILRTICCFER